jgi:hypothetical protein
MMLGVFHEKNPDLSEEKYSHTLTIKALDDPERLLFVDWQGIQHIPAFTLPEAVALSLNINPEYADLTWIKKFCDFIVERLDPNSELWHKRVSALEERAEWDDFNWEHVAQAKIQQKVPQFQAAIEVLSEFETRLNIARRNLAPHGDIQAIASPDNAPPMVKLTEFGRFAESAGWNLPKDFLQVMPSTKDNPISDLDKPMGNRERRTLLVIIAALAKDLGIDIAHPSAAATSIEPRTTKIGSRIAARTIEEKLKLIPDALKTFEE